MDASFALARYNYGTSLFNAGKTDEAITQFRQCVLRFPDLADAANALGYAYMREERWADAVAAYEGFLKAEPGHVEARVNLAHCLKELDRFEEAVGHLEAIAAALANAGRTADAAAVTERAIEIAGEGELERAAERLREARREYAEDPGTPEPAAAP